MQKLLITGGTGYLGSRLSLYLAEKGYKVTVLGRFEPEQHYAHWYRQMNEVVLGDICDKDIFSALTKHQFDAIINFISLDHTQSETDARTVFSINTLPSWQLLENFAQRGLKRFIYFSTQKVLGRIPSSVTAIDESYVPHPANKYGLTHLLSEQIVNYYNEITSVFGINIRLSNAYGSPVFNETKCWQYVINELCKMAFEKQEICLLSDGSPLRDFIHIDDICRATEVLLNTENVNPLYYLASGHTITILEAALIIQSVYKDRYGIDIPIKLPNQSVSKNLTQAEPSNHYILSTKGMQELGIQAEVNLQEGIHEVFEYLDGLVKN